MRQDMVNSIIQHVVNKSGISYVNTHNDAFSLGGFAALFCSAFYVNPDRQSIESLQRIEVVCINPNLGPFSDERKLSLFFHEISHATGRANRLSRVAITTTAHQKRDHNIEEIIAEKSAYALMLHFGMSTDETIKLSHDYIESHLSALPQVEHDFISALVTRESDKAVAYILTHWLNDFKIESEVA